MKDWIILIVIVAIFLVPFIGIIVVDYCNEQILTIKVEDKYIKRSGESDIYLVVDSEGNTYKIGDLLFIGKFNSTDLYNKMKIGEIYEIELTGYRFQIFSMYQNINKILSKEVK